jgi:hypothetical protein
VRPVERREQVGAQQARRAGEDDAHGAEA